MISRIPIKWTLLRLLKGLMMLFRMDFIHFILLALFIILPFKVHAQAEDSAEEIIEDAHEVAAVGPKKGNFVPVPMIISNPTIGTGLQAVLMYLHPKSDNNVQSPNATSGVMGIYTDTDSWFAGIFHDNYLADDSYRISGFLGYGDFKLKYYGIGGNPILEENPIDYDFTLFIFAPKFLVRVPNTSNWFAGTSYIYLDTDSHFKTSDIIEYIPDLEFSASTAGLGLITTYDSRDSNYYPTKGQFFEAKLTNYSDTWGGDYEYNKFVTFFNYYKSLKENMVLALRGRSEFSGGNAPYFDLPFLDMRGFDRGRYRDENTFSLHAESRYKFRPRWGMIAFVESGWFGEEIDELFSNETVISYGGGIRWQVTRDNDMNLGMDVAFSNDDYAIYIQIGERF